MVDRLIIDLNYRDNTNNIIKINNFCKNHNISKKSIVYMDLNKAYEKMNDTLSICDKKYIKYIGSHINYNNDFIVMNLFCL